MLGHSQSVIELALHPKDTDILLSASRDDTVRMWQISTGQCLTIYSVTNAAALVSCPSCVMWKFCFAISPFDELNSWLHHRHFVQMEIVFLQLERGLCMNGRSLRLEQDNHARRRN